MSIGGPLGGCLGVCALHFRAKIALCEHFSAIHFSYMTSVILYWPPCSLLYLPQNFDMVQIGQQCKRFQNQFYSINFPFEPQNAIFQYSLALPMLNPPIGLVQQPALSSTEVEQMALGSTISEALWLRQLLEDVQLKLSSPTIVHYDFSDCQYHSTNLYNFRPYLGSYH